VGKLLLTFGGWIVAMVAGLGWVRERRGHQFTTRALLEWLACFSDDAANQPASADLGLSREEPAA
jgi:hypothetical protein